MSPAAVRSGRSSPPCPSSLATRASASSLPSALSYAVDAMQRITTAAAWTLAITADIAIILAFTVAALVGGALTLRRRTP